MLPRSFYFLRHGETDWNKEKRFQGSSNIPLNENGRDQARRSIDLVKRLPIDRIVASPLDRAYETARIINTILQKPLETDDRLRENHSGIYEGMTHQEVLEWEKDNPEKMGIVEPETGYAVAPDGELYADFQKRVIAACAEYIKRYPSDNILFVAHGGIYSVLNYTLLKEIKHHPSNTVPYHFIKNDLESWELICLSEK